MRSWNTQHGGSYTGVTGTLNIALNGLGADTNNIHVSELSVCGNSFKYRQLPSVTKDGPGTFILSGN